MALAPSPSTTLLPGSAGPGAAGVASLTMAAAGADGPGRPRKFVKARRELPPVPAAGLALPGVAAGTGREVEGDADDEAADGW